VPDIVEAILGGRQPSEVTPGGTRLDSRNQARWIPHSGAARGVSRKADSRNGYDFSERFPLIVAAIEALPVRSCALDGEAIACYENGLSVFEMTRWRKHDRSVTLCAFDLIGLDGEDPD
jgi:ATP-dependent DNA ligase